MPAAKSAYIAATSSTVRSPSGSYQVCAEPHSVTIANAVTRTSSKSNVPLRAPALSTARSSSRYMRLIARIRRAVLLRQRRDARAHAERDVEHLGDLRVLQPPAHVRGRELAQPRSGSVAVHCERTSSTKAISMASISRYSASVGPATVHGRAHGPMMAC